MNRFADGLFRMALLSALAGSLCVQTISAGETVKKKNTPAAVNSSDTTPISKKQPAVQQTCAPKSAAVAKGITKMMATDPNVLNIDSVKIVPPQTGSNLLQWVCRVTNTSPLQFEAQSVYVGGYQKTSEGLWTSVGMDSAIGKIGPSATQEYVRPFSISGNSTKFKIKIRQAGTVIKESAEIDLPALQLPQVKIQSAPRTGDGWDVTVKNEQSGYSPTGMMLQIVAAKANAPTAWKGSGAETIPCMAAQATYTHHFTLYLDPSYTIYKVRIILNTNTLDEKNLNL
jgi:hypothetical protein